MRSAMSMIEKLRALLGGGAVKAATEGHDEGQDMISCEQALSLVQEFLDGELEQIPGAQVKAHFDACERCYPHLKLESAFRDAVTRATTGQTAPPELRAKLMELMARADS